MGGENKIKGARLFSFYEDSSCQVRYWILWFLFKQAVQISCAHHHSCLPKFSAWLLFAFEKLLLLSVFWNLNNSPSNVVYCHLFEKGKKRRERKKEMKEWHGEAKLWWSRVCSFIFKGSFYTLSYTFPDMKDTKSCRVSSTLEQFDLHWHQDVFCIPFHLQGSLCYVHYLLAQRPINIFVTLSW